MYARLADDPASAIRSLVLGDVSGLVVATSGSTATPRDVYLRRDSLLASAKAAHARLAGPGRWLLAVPTDRIAGAQVLLRSELAGTEPVPLATGRFTAEAFAAAARRLASATDRGVPLYVSLVPTQLTRIMREPDAARALEVFSAVLVGGGPLDAPEAPSNVVATYGATETSGGCVYGGVPLDGVEVRLDATGRISLGGPTVADAYADGPDDALVERSGTRWFVTSDLGRYVDGRLEVLGRADDVLITGGHKVHSASVERAIAALPGIEMAVVVGVPDLEWGQRVVALIVADDGEPAPSASEVRAALASSLPRFAVPKVVKRVGRIPLLDSGKIDREACRRLAAPEGP